MIKNTKKIALFWFRRDLRLEDNTALNKALASGFDVLPIFIFDQHILEDIVVDDARLSFIHSSLDSINDKLLSKGSSIRCLKGNPYNVWQQLIEEYEIAEVFVNKDYEPFSKERDDKIKQLLESHGIAFNAFKDQVIFEENEIIKEDGSPYTMFTPYKNKWIKTFQQLTINPKTEVAWENFMKVHHPFPSLLQLGFIKSNILVKDVDLNQLDHYNQTRDFPAADSTSYLSPHLRYGTLSIRKIITALKAKHATFLGELIWREFFMQIMHHFPKVVNQNFKSKYDKIRWNNNEDDFKKWCEGKTGYPLVDAGMRQLNESGYMHNRVRMVTASFLCKHLLIDWRWGEAYFAQKLLDYELSSNNGNWQWVAGTGCDSAPYFRIFNPSEQLKKFDKDKVYVKKWVPEYGTEDYPEPMIDHSFARNRTLKAYKVINE